MKGTCNNGILSKYSSLYPMPTTSDNQCFQYVFVLYIVLSVCPLIMAGSRYLTILKLYDLHKTLFLSFSDTNRCGTGLCIQHQLTHWVLIWNNTLPYWPPLQFTRIELPGYCTWENVHVPPGGNP